MAMTTGGGEDEVMSEINITPFTDVLLVLLIIFIILASVIKEPRMPDAKNRDKVKDSQIVVIINAENQIQIGHDYVGVRDASEKFAELHALFPDLKDIIIKANPKTHYGVILQVMDAAKTAGLNQFGLANHVEGTPQGAIE